MSQRTIKFRAWDKEYENMYQNAYPFEHLVYVEMDKNDPGIEEHKHKMHEVNGKWFYFIIAKDIEVMQFTGVLDCNNKEIYEGDIVRWEAAGTVHTQIVRWENDRAMFLPNDMKGEVEVIGNVHETPELVKQEGA